MLDYSLINVHTTHPKTMAFDTANHCLGFFQIWVIFGTSTPFQSKKFTLKFTVAP